MFDRIKIFFDDYKQKITTYNKIAHILQVIRRYFTINSFDGVITTIGVLIGNYIISSQDYKHVIISGSAVCISLLVSGAFSAFISESAERSKEIRDLEKSTLHILDGTIISRAQSFASKVLSAVNGLSAGVTAFIPLLPFFFGRFVPINICYYASASLAFLILIGLGLFLGKISRKNLIISIVKMILAGLFCVGLGFLLELV
jgi:predicted membrane protein (TIGR00267 family)